MPTSPLGCPFPLAVFYSNLHVWSPIYVLIRPLRPTLTSDWLSLIRSSPLLTSQADGQNLLGKHYQCVYIGSLYTTSIDLININVHELKLSFDFLYKHISNKNKLTL
jgi:hypothetical protein